MKADGAGKEQYMENQRTAYGEHLVKLGRDHEAIVACEADLGKSTMSCLFEEAFPDRFFEMGIGEQNMASFAAGLALAGKIPFINSFATFVTARCYEQIKVSICIGNFNVKIIGSSYGLSDYGDGATHQSFEDISLMRSLPNMTVFAPVDAQETREMLDAALAINGPVYMRVNRNDMPVIYGTGPEDRRAAVGRPSVIREGQDAVVFAHGIMVTKALEAAEVLAAEGIQVRVVNVSTLKPVDDNMIRDLALTRGTRCVVVAEEHTLYNGLCSVVEHALSGSAVPIGLVAIEDRFGQSAQNYDILLEAYGLTADHIVDAVRKHL